MGKFQLSSSNCTNVCWRKHRTSLMGLSKHICGRDWWFHSTVANIRMRMLMKHLFNLLNYYILRLTIENIYINVILWPKLFSSFINNPFNHLTDFHTNNFVSDKIIKWTNKFNDLLFLIHWHSCKGILYNIHFAAHTNIIINNFHFSDK
jgi:hypothetical protein